MAKPQYSKPTSQLDLEERQKSDYVPPSQLVQGSDPDLSDNGYVGVDPIYQNYANETEKPGLAESGPEKKVEASVYADDVDTSQGATDEGEKAAEDDDEDDDKTPPSGGQTPPSS